MNRQMTGPAARMLSGMMKDNPGMILGLITIINKNPMTSTLKRMFLLGGMCTKADCNAHNPRKTAGIKKSQNMLDSTTKKPSSGAKTIMEY